MPLYRGHKVTIALLTYRDTAWVKWALEGIRAARTAVSYRTLVLANDPEPQVAADQVVDAVFHNDDPAEYYINRVYRAWNEAVLLAPTRWVVLMNSDMYPADHWLDELMAVRRDGSQSLPTSLLVESGRIPSALPETVLDCGLTPATFDRAKFNDQVKRVRRPGKVLDGGLYMPVLLEREEFLDLGCYPAGNPAGTTGDKDLFARYAAAGFRHVTALGSVCYHAMEGEMRG